MIIWGFRSFVALLCTLRMQCVRCGNEAAHRLVRSRRYFTLFFLPVVPIRTQYVLTCTFCGCASAVSPAQATQLCATEGTVRDGSPGARWSQMWRSPSLQSRMQSVRALLAGNQRALAVIAGGTIAAVVLGIVVGHTTQSPPPSTPSGVALAPGESESSSTPVPSSTPSLDAFSPAAATPTPSSTAPATPAPRRPDLQGFGQMVVDPSHQHVFISSGKQQSSVVVVDYQGNLVAVVDSLYGATGLALSSDQHTVYAGLANGDAVAAIDTASLQVRDRWSSGAHSCPAWLALAANRLWIGEGCGQWEGRLASFDPAHPAEGFSAVPGPTMPAAPYLASPGPSSVLLAAGQEGISSGEVDLYRLSGTHATKAASESDGSDGGDLGDLAFSPSGDVLVVAASTPDVLERYTTPTLSRAGDFPVAAFPSAVAYTADGRFLAGGVDRDPSDPTVFFFDAASQQQTKVDYPGDVAGRGIALTPDGRRAFVVTMDRRDPTRPVPLLHVLTGPEG